MVSVVLKYILAKESIKEDVFVPHPASSKQHMKSEIIAYFFIEAVPFSVMLVSESLRIPGRIVIRLELHDTRRFIHLLTTPAFL